MLVPVPVTFINFWDKQEWLFSLRSWQHRRILQINPGFGNIPSVVPGYVLAGTMTTSWLWFHSCPNQSRGKSPKRFPLADASSFANNLLNCGTSSRRLHENKSAAVPGGQRLCTATVKTDFTFMRPYCHALYNAAGIPSGAASDWVARLQTFHAGESRAGWSSLMRQERATAEPKQRSHPFSVGACPPPLGWIYRATGGPSLEGDAEPAARSFLPRIDVAVSTATCLSLRFRLKGWVAHNVHVYSVTQTQGAIHKHTHTHKHNYADFLFSLWSDACWECEDIPLNELIAHNQQNLDNYPNLKNGADSAINK